ncbi:sensor histidine kinase [Cytophaga hutchinsonii]|jgi:PAS domain S-box-containing protein|uniref:histidine kinase n=1 Tax=Cytophaga hutchinsonii (strain ATCC 33406 / DSM 1761 / CIP 103989 / NBRC 15051 / NCIMB 9469 / D465) TaxID=269798 RepID=A0A6N4SSF9_CYTH3|nr:ATP-binding protein [Cytophaga hutchinsonii]ABG59340.1 sensor histidine kinase/response regulator fusion protein (sensor for arcA) [Cytophaga hutchinsonii ATCC 33406]SFX92096.1 PAS domain S-box-containing protein [Cytophaga hutchinsonii ATCC 33406]
MKEGKANILIIDDISSNIFALENLLMTENRTFFKATSGDEGLKLALSKPVDLIILDVQMPEMDGFEVANMLKSNKRTKDIPILFASAELKEQKNMLKGLEEGAIDYLFKPLDPEITKAKVNMLIRLELQRKEMVEINSALEKSAILINNCLDIICTIDAETFKFEAFNVAMTNVLGYSSEEITSQSLLFFLQESDREFIKNLKKSDSNTGSFEIQIICKDSSIKWLQWNIVVKGGKWFSNARDITERKKKDDEIIRLNQDLHENIQQLENANKELESFSYSVSHDLRAPLRSINNYAQMLEDAFAAQMDEKSTRLLGNIKRNAFRMDTLIDDLLAFSRLGRKPVQKQSINMNDLVQHVYADMQGTFKGEFVLPALPDIDADYNLLKQVVVNLLSNAIKYSGKIEEPRIEVGYTKNPNAVVYYIKDNGAGFDMEYSDKLFGVFQRLHSTKEFEGTGVGLAIVKRIVEKHGGTIWAEAKVGEGATFYFSLPAPV